MKSAGLGEYLKRAFLYRWNLLLFIGASAAAALSPFPDATIPLVIAAEVAYLGGVVSRPKFRDAIDARVYKESRDPNARQPGGESLFDIVNSLPAIARNRFDTLRMRCLQMKNIAQGVSGVRRTMPADDLSTTPALDRLLWVFLRLLVSQRALEQFQASTSEAEISQRLEEARARLANVGQDERFKRSLEDSVAAQELRLKNYKKAAENALFVRLELDRIEAKIQALAESSVNRQDPDSLTNQIEGVAESVQSTESAIKELQHITGLVDQMQEPPAILDADFRKVAQ